MTTIQKIMQLLSNLTDYQRVKLYRIFNQITENVFIPETQDVRSLAEFIRNLWNGKRNMISFSKKVYYGYEKALQLKHYKTGDCLLDDFLNGKKIYIKSYR